jgi:carboxymethylenebutenolidase
MNPRNEQLDTRQQQITTPTGTPASVVRPVGDGPWPGVVMIHELFGINDVLLRQAHRLASSGYVVLAPDLISEGRRLACMRSLFRALRA